uniref:Uncharacterized protein n=1 Tax=uncultured Planctomycetota bacterium TaxID=120965 RepID=H5SFR1_9BACT|nr:hypothetical protein HGMM_F22C11C12 [uncultured Planctomycetota bacterium]
MAKAATALAHNGLFALVEPATDDEVRRQLVADVGAKPTDHRTKSWTEVTIQNLAAKIHGAAHAAGKSGGPGDTMIVGASVQRTNDRQQMCPLCQLRE